MESMCLRNMRDSTMTIEENQPNKKKQSHLSSYSKPKKPKFRRQESWRYKRVSNHWRKPHGVDSKMRKKIKGWPLSPTIGYRSPKKIRGLHPSGFVEVRVQSIEDLGGIDPDLQAIRIAHTVGSRKRVEIISLAEQRGIKILNSRAIRETEDLTEQELENEEAVEAGEN